MPHTPGHNQPQREQAIPRMQAATTTAYRVYGTGEPYSGKVVLIGGYFYTTHGGAYEGTSLQLEQVGSTMDDNQEPTTNINPNPNPVTRTFVSRVTYYRQDGTAVPPGTDLHQHQDGTIMMGHDPNNMGAIVTRNQPINNQGVTVSSGNEGMQNQRQPMNTGGGRSAY